MKRFRRQLTTPKQRRKVSKKLASRRQSATRLDYDSLEPRLALTAFVVNSAIDDATGTVDGLIGLREAVIAANTNEAFGDAEAGEETGDTIQFSIAGETLTLDAGEISITDDLEILGASSSNTIDGNGSDRIFSIDTNESVAIARITLSDGRASQGGAIFSTGFGARILVGVTFDNNLATGSGGGAIYHETGNIFITDSDFSNNRAIADNGRGGAIYLGSGRLSVTRGEMVSNSAGFTGGAIEVNGGDVFMNDAQIGNVGQGNTAGAGNSNGKGGGLNVSATTSNVYVNGGEFNSNTASHEGGGLWNQADATMLIQSNARIINNIASGDALVDGGGGIFNAGGYLVVNNSTVSLNSAEESGGGILSTSGDVLVTGSTVASNQASRTGGGIQINRGSMFVVNSTIGGATAFFGNVAEGDSPIPGAGGGIHISGENTASVYVLNTRVENNIAGRTGGGLWNAPGSLLRIDNNSKILSNRTIGPTGGGGGIFNNGRLTIGNSLINGNRAGGNFASGGGIFSKDGTVLIFSSTLSDNAAEQAGGGIEIRGGFMNLNSVNVTGNNAGTTFNVSNNGGGIHILESTLTRVVVNSGVFANNTAGNDGGGFWNHAQGTLFLQGSVQIDNNSAGNFGGGVYNQGHLQATDAFFTNNDADQGGGFHNAPSGTANVLNVDFFANTADTLGGGIYNNNVVILEDAIVANNVAGTDGGGIYSLAVAGTNLTNVTFSGNLPNDTN